MIIDTPETTTHDEYIPCEMFALDFDEFKSKFRTAAEVAKFPSRNEIDAALETGNGMVFLSLPVVNVDESEIRHIATPFSKLWDQLNLTMKNMHQVDLAISVVEDGREVRMEIAPPEEGKRPVVHGLNSIWIAADSA